MIWLVAIDGVPIFCELCGLELDGPVGQGGRCDCVDHHIDCCPFLAAMAEASQKEPQNLFFGGGGPPGS